MQFLHAYGNVQWLARALPLVVLLAAFLPEVGWKTAIKLSSLVVLVLSPMILYGWYSAREADRAEEDLKDGYALEKEGVLSTLVIGYQSAYFRLAGQWLQASEELLWREEGGQRKRFARGDGMAVEYLPRSRIVIRIVPLAPSRYVGR